MLLLRDGEEVVGMSSAEPMSRLPEIDCLPALVYCSKHERRRLQEDGYQESAWWKGNCCAKQGSNMGTALHGLSSNRYVPGR
jgi:hypothetical protein